MPGLTKEKYETREKAVLNLKVTDENGQPVVSHLGVTVFDKIYQNNHDPKIYLRTSICHLS
jgi:hypothetical protein